jgi:hypothetical protein
VSVSSSRPCEKVTRTEQWDDNDALVSLESFPLLRAGLWPGVVEKQRPWRRAQDGAGSWALPCGTW